MQHYRCKQEMTARDTLLSSYPRVKFTITRWSVKVNGNLPKDHRAAVMQYLDEYARVARPILANSTLHISELLQLNDMVIVPGEDPTVIVDDIDATYVDIIPGDKKTEGFIALWHPVANEEHYYEQAGLTRHPVEPYVLAPDRAEELDQICDICSSELILVDSDIPMDPTKIENPEDSFN